jgi:hypothetical protein
MKNFMTKIKNFCSLDVFLFVFFWGLFNLLYAYGPKPVVENNIVKITENNIDLQS